MKGGEISYRDQVEQAASYIKEICADIPDTAIPLGTGLGELASGMEVENEIAYEDIPCFPKSTVESHRGALLIGSLGGCRALILSGRFHFYEGYSTREITLPILLDEIIAEGRRASARLEKLIIEFINRLHQRG